MGQLKRVVVLDQHDLLEDGLVGLGSDLAKGSRVPRFEHALDLLDELVHRVERSPVLERLDGVEKTKSRMLVSGLLGGWLRSLVFQPSAVPAAKMSGSSLML